MSKDKKGLMSTWKDLDDTLFDKEEVEEANICLMTDTTSKESKSDQDDEVHFDDPKSFKQAYHELFSNSSILSKDYKKLGKDFKKLSKDHKEFKKAFHDKAEISMHESTQVCYSCETLKIKETKLFLENDKISKERITLLKNFQELENKLKALQKDLKELNELHDHVKTERYDIWK